VIQRLMMLTCSMAFLFSCASFQKETSLQAPIDYADDLDTAVYLMKQKRYDQAETKVKNYLLQTTDLYEHGSALLLLGEIYEETDNIERATDTYKKLVDHGAGYHSSQMVKALYKLSWLYERRQMYEDVLVLLVDLKKNLRNNDDFIKNVETPARLANTYYVLNKWDKALQYRSEALNRLQHSDYSEQAAEMLARSYFYLSLVQLEPNAKVDRHYSEVISAAQKDLLRLVESDNLEIHKKAAQLLLRLYQSYFDDIIQHPAPKNAVEKNQTNTMIVQNLAKLMDGIEELKALRRPDEVQKNPEAVNQFFVQLKVIEDRTRTLAHKLELGIQSEKKTKKRR
jgi:tetratricopeptide (TPR) repeat protein